MESTNEPSFFSESDKTAETKNEPVSQSELIQQWRANLASLKKDKSFEVPKELDENDKKLIHSLDAIAYLDNKNTLLDENKDFQLSDNGFLTYKTKHMIAFEYLSQLKKPELKISSPKFYFISRVKHLEQLSKSNRWTHTLFHFLITLMVILVLGFTSLLVVVKTQDNLLVEFLLGWFWIVNIKTTTNLIRKYKKLATTPFRFSISLLGIHSLNILMKVNLLCILPLLIVSAYNVYWIDDIIIISLFITCLTNFKHASKPSEQFAEKDLTEAGKVHV